MRTYGMTNAAWSHNWMMDIEFWNHQWEADKVTLGHDPTSQAMVYSNQWEALVFTTEASVYYFASNTFGGNLFSSSGLNDAQRRLGIQPRGSLGFPTVSTPLPDANGIYWGNSTNGFNLLYADGSQDVFAISFLAPAGGDQTTAEALLTQRIDAQNRVTRIGYELNTFQSKNYYRIRYVVDPDGRTNTFLYVTSSPKHPWQLAEVDDPFGRKAQLAYGTSGVANGLLTSIIDAANNTNSFAYYGTNGWITNMTTPYGATGFSTYQFLDDPSQTNNSFTTRALLVSEPEMAHQLFLYSHTNNYLANTEGSPVITGVHFDNGSNGANHPSLSFRNTYHWDRRQYEALSSGAKTGFLSSLQSGLLNLSSNDYQKADLKHWLWQTDGLSVSESLSSERMPSPDAAGTIEGTRIWYSYPNELVEVTTEGDPQPSCIAQLFPDGTSSQYTIFRYFSSPAYRVGLVSDNETTYTQPDGTVGLRTNWFTYSTNGIDLLAITNSFGQWTKFAYTNAHHLLNFATNALNQVTIFNWDDGGTQDLLGITWPSGETITLNYGFYPFNNSVLPQTITLSPQGRTITVNEYTNALPRTISLSGTSIPTLLVTNTWDGLNRLTSTLFPDGTTVSNIFNRLNLVATRDRLGFWTYFGYDGLEHLTSITNALTNVTTFTWCNCGSLTSITDSLTNLTTLLYNNQELLTGINFPDGSSVTNVYDTLGRVSSSTDGSTRGLTYGYNNQGLVTVVSNAYGPVSQVTYDALDRAQIVTDANNVSVTNAFDLLNRTVVRTWPSGGGFEGFLWSTNGLLAYTNQDLRVTWFSRDGAGRVTAIVNANGETNQFSYDALGHVTNLVDGLNRSPTVWHYNEYGWLTNKVDALGHEVFHYIYDPNGEVTNRWTPQFAATAYSYDPLGNLTNINYGSSSVAYAYDALNRLQSMTDAAGSSTFSYTQIGQLLTEATPWANGTITYGYSQRNRSSANLNSSPAMNVSYGYDSAWRLQTLTSPAGSFGYGYSSGSSSAASLVRSITLPNSAWITNHFDGLDQLDYTALVNRWGLPVDSYSYTHDAWGLRKTISRDLGLATNTVSLNYDLIGQLTNWSAQEFSGTARLNEQIGWSYDKAGNLNNITNGAFVESFTVDSLNQISNISRLGNLTLSGATPAPATSVTVNGFTAQPYNDLTFARTNLALVNGQNSFTNIAQNTYGAKATNIVTLTLSNTVVLLYDLNGNLTNDGIRSFTYDAENRLVTNWVPSTWKSEFVYDGLGRRRVERDYGWVSGAWSKTNELRFVYDGYLIIQERDANNNVLVSYTRGPDFSGSLQGAGGIGGLLARTDGNGSTFYHSDGAGNITGLIDSQQNMAARYLYGPYGRLLGKWGTMADANEMQFSSMPRHLNSGLSLYPFRGYDPSFQRWLNRDPIGEAGGINLYQFVGNSPPNTIDPFGLENPITGPGRIAAGPVSGLANPALFIPPALLRPVYHPFPQGGPPYAEMLWDHETGRWYFPAGINFDDDPFMLALPLFKGPFKLTRCTAKLRLPATMTDELSAYQQAAKRGLLVKTQSSALPPSNARAIWEAANGPVPEGFDVDHIIQRQFGGTDELSNLQLKPSGLNRSEGSQARWLNQSSSYGTVFNNVELVDPR
jgi:RHS repeat-associated protein